jgi:DNA repair protein RadC
VEAWPGEALIAAVLAPGASKSARATAASEAAVSLLCEMGGFGGLARATIGEIEAQLATAPRLRLPPLAAARRIAAAFELGRRAANDAVAPTSIASSADVAAWASMRLSSLDHEELWLLALDGRSRLRAVRCVAKGGLHGMGVRPADPIRLALRASASGFVLVHNHPSGDPTPSPEDVAFTQRVAAAAAVVGTPLLDHVVVVRGGFASVPFAVEGPPLASAVGA